MNIAMISGLLAAAGGNNPVSGLTNLAGTSGGIDFAALLKAAGKGQTFGSAEFSAELQALFANAGGSKDAKGFDLAALLSAGAKQSKETVALAGQDIAANDTTNEPQLAAGTDLQSPLPTEALLAAIAQALAGQSTLTPAQGSAGEQRLADATSEGESKPPMVADMATAAMISPASATRSGSLATEARGEDSPPAASNRLLFSVDRSSNPGANVLSNGNPSNNPLFAGKDGESFARNLAEAANTAAAPIGNAGMAATAASAHRTHESPATPAPIASPLHDRSVWTQDFGDRIVWMAKQDQQSADIRITPANLGPVQISLNIEDGKASAVFASPHAEVRQAIEEALPRLREMLNSAGISLDQANVGSQMPQQQSDNAARFAAAPRSTGENAILPGDEGRSVQTVVTPLNRGRGLVDLFA